MVGIQLNGLHSSSTRSSSLTFPRLHSSACYLTTHIINSSLDDGSNVGLNIRRDSNAFSRVPKGPKAETTNEWPLSPHYNNQGHRTNPHLYRWSCDTIRQRISPHSAFICAFSISARLSSTIAKVSRAQYRKRASSIVARSTQSVSTKTIR